MNYCALMVDAYGLDLDEIVMEKIKRNDEKYFVDNAYGSKKKYNKLE